MKLFGKKEIKSLGIVAGGGLLAEKIYITQKAKNISCIVLGIEGMTSPHIKTEARFSVGEIGKFISHFKQAGCTHITIAGHITRPKLTNVKTDELGKRLLKKILLSPLKGNDHILKIIIEAIERESLSVLSPTDLLDELKAPLGCLTKIKPDETMKQDVDFALKLRDAISPFDIGQSLCVCNGVVLAIEGPEETNEMLARVGTILQNYKLKDNIREGILLKYPKHCQERVMDLPGFGVETIEMVGKVGLAGIVYQADGALFLQKEEMIKRANALGLFLLGRAY